MSLIRENKGRARLVYIITSNEVPFVRHVFELLHEQMLILGSLERNFLAVYSLQFDCSFFLWICTKLQKYKGDLLSSYLLLNQTKRTTMGSKSQAMFLLAVTAGLIVSGGKLKTELLTIFLKQGSYALYLVRFFAN